MKNFQTILFGFIAIICLASCKGISMKDEQAFAEKVSASMNGLPVNVSAAVGASTEEGSYRRLEIEINDYKTSPDFRDMQMIYATSVPALLYYNDSALKKKNYTTVKVIVNEERTSAEEIYTLKELEQVERCHVPYNGFVDGLRMMNEDSLLRYVDPAVWENLPLDSLMSTLHKITDSVGHVASFTFGGFQKDPEHKAFLFPVFLHRKSMNHRVLVLVDPLTKKVINFKL